MAQFASHAGNLLSVLLLLYTSLMAFGFNFLPRRLQSKGPLGILCIVAIAIIVSG